MGNVDVFFDELFSSESAMQSAPPHMQKQPFQTKWPEHEAKHIRGECKPCAYYFKKADGCRLGAQCGFCHLCPEGAMKARKKEKMRALRQQQQRERQQEQLAQKLAKVISSNSDGVSSRSGSTTPSAAEDVGCAWSVRTASQSPPEPLATSLLQNLRAPLDTQTCGGIRGSGNPWASMPR